MSDAGPSRGARAVAAPEMTSRSRARVMPTYRTRLASSASRAASRSPRYTADSDVVSPTRSPTVPLDQCRSTAGPFR